MLPRGPSGTAQGTHLPLKEILRGTARSLPDAANVCLPRVETWTRGTRPGLAGFVGAVAPVLRGRSGLQTLGVLGSFGRAACAEPTGRGGIRRCFRRVPYCKHR